MSSYDYDNHGVRAHPGPEHQPQPHHQQPGEPSSSYNDNSSNNNSYNPPNDPHARKHDNADGDYYDDDDDDSSEDDEEFEDEEDRARDAEKKRKQEKKQAKVYDVEDTRADADDSDDDDPSNPKKRDFWGREQKNRCDCCRNCLLACCRGFCVPPACDPRRFCECPHGWCYTTMGVILGIGGLVMSAMYIISCDVERIVILYDGEKPPNAPRIGYGFIARGTTFEEAPTYMSCIRYTDQEKAAIFDGWMHTARFFLFLSTAFGVIGTIVLFLAICIAWSPNTFEHWLMWNFVFAALSIPMSYMLFGSPLCDANDCKLGQGGVQCISIFLFWLTCANTVKSFPAAMPPDRDEDESDEGEDNDDLYYETEEDMWNDRRPPPRPKAEGEQRGLTDDMEPEYLDDDDYADYEDSYRNKNDRQTQNRMQDIDDDDDDDDDDDRRRGQVQHYDDFINKDPYGGGGSGDSGYYDPNDPRMYDDDDGSQRHAAAAQQGQGRDPYYTEPRHGGAPPPYQDPYNQQHAYNRGAPGDYDGQQQQHPGHSGDYDDRTIT